MRPQYLVRHAALLVLVLQLNSLARQRGDRLAHDAVAEVIVRNHVFKGMFTPNA